MFFRQGTRRYSYEDERLFESVRFPMHAKPYDHLGPYLKCWMDPDAAFRDKHVLDFGAGEAMYTRFIAERYNPASITAADLFTERMLPAARGTPHPLVRYIAGDCFYLPFRDSAFDVVFGSGVLCWLVELEKVAQEIHRVLAKGGRYWGIEPNCCSLVHLYRHFFSDTSPNEILLTPRSFQIFTRYGMTPRVTFFNARLPRFRSRLLTTCMGIEVRKAP